MIWAADEASAGIGAKYGQAIPGKDAETPCHGRSVSAIPGKNGNKISQVIISFSIFVIYSSEHKF